MGAYDGHTVGTRKVNCGAVDLKSQGYPTSANGETTVTTGSIRGLCQALRPVTTQLVTETDAQLDIRQPLEPTIFKEGEPQGFEPPYVDSGVHSGQQVNSGMRSGEFHAQSKYGEIHAQPNPREFHAQSKSGEIHAQSKSGEIHAQPNSRKFHAQSESGEFHAQSKPKECHARSNSREFHAQPKPRDFGGVGARKESSPEPIKICQLKSASQFSMNIQVGNRCVSAVVDSAAEVSLISDKVYRSLAKPPKKLQDVTLHTAGRQMVMKGFIVGPVHLKIGSKWYHEILHVAPIEQDMLLGFDILCHRGKSVLDMVKGTLNFDGQVLSLDVGSSTGQAQVARVTVAKRHVIPPNAVAQLPCKLSHEMSDYVMEPVDNLKVLAPRVVRRADQEPVMCLVNISDRYQLIKKGTEIARAYPIDEFVEESDQEDLSPPQESDGEDSFYRD